jgi:alpha,alpha-trehalose-phosphate synthase [UDP-forming]
MWTKEALHGLIDEKLRDHKLIVVANRAPYIHHHVGGQTVCMRPASGMATAIDPILRACGGIWVAHGSGSADRHVVDQHDHIGVPPEDPRYTLRRVWLSKEQEAGYYYGLSNEGLWPLCHVTFTRPEFNPAHWRRYREVNELFAKAVLEEAGGEPAFVFIQDYHFGLLPRILKESNPNLIVAQFWHIPWPNREVFRVFPWAEELLHGMLGNDLLGFHLRYHCQNFLDTVDRAIEARVDQERSEITRQGKLTVIRQFPISIDFEAHCDLAAGPAVEAEIKRWRRQLDLGDRLLGIGIERLDYTKGIPERLRAFDHFLAKHPEHAQRITFLQIAVPSRSHIPQYQRIEEEVDRLVEQINWKWGTVDWQPVLLFKQHFDPPAMIALHRMANFCIVSSLHDGMNLVAKEFVTSRLDEDGALILSQFTGTARELTDALLVNPYDLEGVAGAILRACTMNEPERRRRMQRMRTAVANNNIYRWAGKVISALLHFEIPENV